MKILTLKLRLGVPHSNAANPVICEGWHFTHMSNTLARSYHSTKSEWV